MAVTSEAVIASHHVVCGHCGRCLEYLRIQYLLHVLLFSLQASGSGG